MDIMKLKNITKKNRFVAFVFWIALIYLIFLAYYAAVYKNVPTIVQFLFVFAISSFVYLDIVVTLEYFKTKRIIDHIKTIHPRYKYIHTYADSTNLFVEVEKKDEERLIKDLSELNTEFKQFKSSDKLVKYIVNLR